MDVSSVFSHVAEKCLATASIPACSCFLNSVMCLLPGAQHPEKRRVAVDIDARCRTVDLDDESHRVLSFSTNCDLQRDTPTDMRVLQVRPSRCVTGEDKVARFDGLVAGKAGVVHRLVGGVCGGKISEPPTL